MRGLGRMSLLLSQPDPSKTFTGLPELAGTLTCTTLPGSMAASLKRSCADAKAATAQMMGDRQGEEPFKMPKIRKWLDSVFLICVQSALM